MLRCSLLFLVLAVVLAAPATSAAQTWYLDFDLDGYGDPNDFIDNPTQPPGYVANSGDCDDSDATVYPGAPELVDGQDNDCDGFLDALEEDADADGYILGAVDGGGWDGPGPAPGDYDCNDSDDTVYPGAPELTDGQDNDCDGHLTPDEEDWDGDGYIAGTLDASGWDGNLFALYSGDNDCDDANWWVHPNRNELCDGLDNDCNALVDDGLEVTWYEDLDGDGYGTQAQTMLGCGIPSAGWAAVDGDCDDSDEWVHPGAPEFCDGVDNDCNGSVEDDAFVTIYEDIDGDGYGEVDVGGDCARPGPNQTWRSGDCDDWEPSINPGASDFCDGIDNNCDGDPDNDALVISIYLDQDEDGWGDVFDTTICADPGFPVPVPGLSFKTGDCDDQDSTTYPGAPELCDGWDNDCDLATDEVTVYVLWYDDLDNDGYGTETGTANSCDNLEFQGYSFIAGDCDDSNEFVYPGSFERCNGIDDDCDNLIDESGPDEYYIDNDGDGWGTNVSIYQGCSPPPGYVVQNGDCNDQDPDVFPGGQELCDGKDNDCNGEVDEGLVFDTYWADSDGDGFGDPNDFLSACDLPVGYVSNDLDCADDNGNVYPGAPELCDGRDNDCNGLVDDGLSPTAYYQDFDGDGYGRPGSPQYSCVPLPGWADNDLDCDDNDPNSSPEGVEICDGRDNNCDGFVDEGVVTLSFYLDNDHDGYAEDGLTEYALCQWEPGYSTQLGDTDDTNPWVYPGAPELCDGVDNDGDGQVDEDVVDVVWYEDQDLDGYGDFTFGISTCLSPIDFGATEGYSTRPGDCNDNDPYRFPGAPERCDGIDNDCDGTVDNGLAGIIVYEDGDGDGWGEFGTEQIACAPRAGQVTRGGDCNDDNPLIHPENIEYCNGIDDDCDGQVDEDVVDLAYYWDRDEDGYGHGGDPVGVRCTPLPGMVLSTTDCDDTRPDVYPGAFEYCDLLDNDCDGMIDENVQQTYYRDMDEDGWGNAGDTVLSCDPPPGYVENSGDCDDENDQIYPEAPEYCNGIDDDCDGLIDNGPTQDGAFAYFYDRDLDGYGNSDQEMAFFCTQGIPPGFSDNDLDCNDDNSNSYPSAEEICDSEDNDCDGQVDEGCDIPIWVSITDVGNDQGRNVRVRWLPPEALDRPGAPVTVLSYSLYRRIAPGMKADGAATKGQAEDPTTKGSEPASVSKVYPPGEWDFVENIPASGEIEYSTVVHTLCDSTSTGVCWSVFFLRAHTPDPLLYFDAEPDSGYSIDNLAPAAPKNLLAAYGSSSHSLSWDENLEQDLQFYRVYRSTVPGFTPTPTELVHTTVSAGWSDTSDPGYGVYYLVSAVDANGNEGPPSAPGTVTGTNELPLRSRYALHAAVPNPFNPRTTISFELPEAESSVRLEIYDVSGRLVSVLGEGEYGPGLHELVWEATDRRGKPLSSGVYLYRLRAGEFTATKRMTLVR